VVGLATSSLGILAEALHSGLDAVAALLSLYAVGVAERPPDEQHQYGHGKAQHLAALSEAAILAAVAIWIGFEAVMRLRSGGGDVQPEWYAFVLLFGVLIVDAARWSVSFRTGTRERNAALLASAWHFASDFAGHHRRADRPGAGVCRVSPGRRRRGPDRGCPGAWSRRRGWRCATSMR
jgi:cation diffusion facilitator family transporter